MNSVWNMLCFNGMGRRKESTEAAVFESVAGFAALVLSLCFFLPEFRHWVQIGLAFLVIISVPAFVIWLVFKINEREPSASAFRASAFKPHQTNARSSDHAPTIDEESRYARRVPELTISEKLRKIDWFQFEKLVELIYQHRGFSVKRLGGANPDGGVDLIVESPDEKFVVQCKHWRKWTVGVRNIRAFIGTLTDSGIPKGIFITLMGYSGEAKQLADKHGIQILNESDVIKMLEESGLIYSKEISELFSDTRKFCPKCESEMVLRSARVKGNQFWGCSNFPRCRFILNFEP
jgi:restriction system protein